MYRPAESVDWCQCCQWGVAFTDFQRSSNLLGDHTPQSSTLLTMPVAFIYLSPFTIHLTGGRLPPLHFEMLVRACRGGYQPPDKAPLCKGGWQKSLISDWGIVLYRYPTIPPSRLRRAISLCTREAFVPTIILQITLLVSVKGRRLYRKIYFLLSPCYDK